MELRHLRYFIAVAEELNFTRAALRLRIAQPPLSQQIQRLEESIGAELFDRRGRRVQLTPAGEQFLHHARTVLAAAGEAVRAARSATDQRAMLVLGFVSSAAYTILPSLIRGYRGQQAGNEIACVEMTIADQLEALERARIDAALLRPPIADPTLETEVLTDEAFVLAVADGMLPAVGASARVRDLDGVPLVFFARGLSPGFHEQLLAYCRANAVEPTIVTEVAQVHTLLALVGGGLGAAFVPASASRLGIPGVRFVPMEEGTPRARYALCWRRDRPPAGIIALAQSVRATQGSVGGARTTRWT